MKFDPYIDTNEMNIPTIGYGYNLLDAAVFKQTVDQIFYQAENPTYQGNVGLYAICLKMDVAGRVV